MGRTAEGITPPDGILRARQSRRREWIAITICVLADFLSLALFDPRRVSPIVPLFVHYLSLIVLAPTLRSNDGRDRMASWHGILAALLLVFCLWCASKNPAPSFNASSFLLFVGILLLCIGASSMIAAFWNALKRLISPPPPEVIGIPCPACGYRVDNIPSTRCPECGTDVSALPRVLPAGGTPKQLRPTGRLAVCAFILVHPGISGSGFA